MPIPAALKDDLTAAKSEHKRLKAEQADKMKAADEVTAKYKADNPDFNWLLAAGAPEGSDEHNAFMEIDAAYKAADDLGEQAAAINDAIAAAASAAGAPIATVDPMATGQAKTAQTIGERLVASAEYQALLASGILATSQRVEMPHVEIASRREARAWLAAASNGAGLISVDQQLNNPVGIPRRAPRLLDLITLAETNSETIEYSYQTTRTDATGNVAPGTASGESTYVWAKATANVKRRAHHTTIFKSQLADSARMETEVNTELTNGVILHTEGQVLAGDGVGENWRGVLNTVGIGTVAKSTDTIADAIHKGMTTVRIALEDDITAIGVHPLDYERYALAKDSNGNYLSGRGPHESTPRSMWGYPAVVSTVFTEGTAVPANWKWAYLWLRSGITLATGYINQQLIEDELTAIAEYRGAFALKQPKAFTTVTGLNT